MKKYRAGSTIFSGFSPGPQTLVLDKFGAGDALVPQTNNEKKTVTILLTVIIYNWGWFRSLVLLVLL